MLLLVTIGLVLVGFVALVIGFVSDSLVPIYVSIICSIAAAGVLVAFSRMTRRQGVGVPDGGATPQPAGASLDETVAVGRVADDTFPIEDYDNLRVSEILPLLGELDRDELQQVRRRETAGRARATVLTRVDEQLADAAPAGEPARVSAGGDDAAFDFPIADYDELRVSEIVPLLGELDGEELQMVRARESGGRGRAMILTRIDELAGGTPSAAASTTKATKKAATKKAATKKVAAKKAATKKTATKKAATKKAATKKVAAKKVPAKATAATSTAKKSGAAKKTAKKTTKAAKKS